MPSNVQTKAIPVSDPAAARTVAGGWLVAAGLAGVVVTSALYALSPPQTVLPSGAPDLAQARALAVGGSATIRAAGLVGIVGDLLFATGATLLALRERPSAVSAMIGWIMIALCGVIFTLVDSLACFVLIPAAADPSAFAAVKLVFDALFIAGTLATGFGMILLFALREPGRDSVLDSVGLLAGCGCIAGVLGCLAGLPAGQLIGLSIALSALCGAWLGYRIAREAGFA